MSADERRSAAALWMLVFALAAGSSTRFAPAAAGFAAPAALVTRPNLLMLAGVVVIFLALRSSASRRERDRKVSRFAAACLPGCLVVAAINATFYGSPFTSGYGSLERRFAAEHIAQNAILYGARLLDTHTPFVLLAVAAPFAAARRDLAVFALGLAIAVASSYLPYCVVQDWWALRFLLPMLPPAIVVAVARWTASPAALACGRL